MKLAAFLRHGATTRSQLIYEDEGDVELSPEGVLQALAAGSGLKHFAPDLVVASPVRRCVESLKHIQAFMTGRVVYDDRLRERSVAALFGMPFSEIAAVYGEEFVVGLRERSEEISFQGAESIGAAMGRVADCVKEHVSKGNSRLLFVSHGGPHSWLLCRALGLDHRAIRQFSIGEGRMSLFEFDDDGSFKRVLLMNCAAEAMVGNSTPASRPLWAPR